MALIKKIMLPALISLGFGVYADTNIEANAGIGFSVSAAGNPSQVSNALAQKESYLSNVTDMAGLPFGVSAFVNLGYRINQNHKAGFEFALGYSTDGGAARVFMGSSLPAYALDGSVGTESDPDIVAFMKQIYAGLSTKNTMKGNSIDPKLRAFYRYDSDKIWSIQVGLGAGLIIPFGYYAYPSRNVADYEKDGQPGIGGAVVWAYPYALNAVQIPFPLVMTDGTTMMRALQPVADLNIRVGLGRYFYFEGSYATEFHYIHNVKIILGLQTKGFNL
jgi:hypothetical protein